MATLPVSIRAALGLAATAIDEARKLPETLPQLPVAVIGTAMQASLRVQQHIAEYAVRGDELISQLRGASDEPPSWATFDDDAQADPATAGNGGPAKAAFELIEEADALIEDDLAPINPEPVTEPVAGTQPVQPSAGPATIAGPDANAGQTAAKKSPAKKSAATAGPAKKAAAKAAPADKTAAAKKPAKKVTRSEPLAVAAERAEPTDRPNPSVMAAEIVQAHQGEISPGDS